MTPAPGRDIVIHGHFYQPPRENPWLETVEIQDGAAPHHDWNERVTAECYGPNTAARRVDAANRILDIVNNFEKMSFNVGPTLMAWLARHCGDVYAKIIEADRASARRTGGRGNAIAQIYNHTIMPLATRRDKVTQIRWGVADFRARFGREPEGMWLPETAVDTDTLEVLAEEGIRFTILAPHQASAVRWLGVDSWEPVTDRIDPSRPYQWQGPRGLSLAVFFYDDTIAREVAFGDALERSERLVALLTEGFGGVPGRPRLVSCATDGETYGHHKRFGEMALAAAFHRIETEGTATLTNYGAFLAAYPPTDEVQIRERTSWSCTHGVERWRADCGCRLRPETQQRWRAPLREALDWLRHEVDALFEARGTELLKDPWAARDAYIEVVLDHRSEQLAEWLATHARGPVGAAARVDILRLLEMQRMRLLMYTSCGWFFDEITALEPVQILKYAAMAMQYFASLGGRSPEGELIRRLEAAPSNRPDFGTGAEAYRRLVQPAAVDLRRVIAHYAISGLFEARPADMPVYAFHVQRLDEARETYGQTAIRIGHVRVRSDITGDTEDADYAVLHFGGPDFSCAIRSHTAAAFEAMKKDVMERYAHLGMADAVRTMDAHFGRDGFTLAHLFLEERRRILERVSSALLAHHEETYRHIWAENRQLAHYLRRVDAPLPPSLALVARHVLEAEVCRELEQVPALGEIPQRAIELVSEAWALGLTLDLLPARPAMRRAVRAALTAIAEQPVAERVARGVTLIQRVDAIGAHYGRWGAQNQFFELWRAAVQARPALTPLADALNFNLSEAAMRPVCS